MKSIKAVILTADRFEDMEVFFPWFRLLEEGVQVEIAGPKKGEINKEYQEKIIGKIVSHGLDGLVVKPGITHPWHG